MPMKVDDTGIMVVVGLLLRTFFKSVIENGVVPLLTVARVLPSGDNARPYGFGAPTLNSAPTGVITLPFGRTAASKPSILTCRLAASLPAGALKLIAFEPPALLLFPLPGCCCRAKANVTTSNTIPSGTNHASEPNRRM